MPFRSQPTYDDVNLCLNLFRMRLEPGFRAARSWFLYEFSASSWQELQKYFDRDRDDLEGFWLVLDYWETAATALVAGVLNEELFYQTNLEMLEVWRKIKPMLSDLRKARGTQTYLQNLEEVARRFEHYLEKTENSEK